MIPRYMISSTKPGESMVFVTKAEHDAFEADIAGVHAKHRALQREKHGIWAANQGKFVQSEDELNSWDDQSYRLGSGPDRG